MAGDWTPSHWVNWNGPGSRTLTLTPGTFISRNVRLVRPIVDMGVQDTWAADHLALQREVSVTFHVPRSSAASLTAADAEHLLRQSSALSHVRLAEPHFVHVIEQGTAPSGVPFIVTELIGGTSLRHRLAHGHPLSLEEAVHVVTQTAGALAHAHAAGVAHGNVCPEMLFLTEVLGKPFVKVLGVGATFDSAGNAPDAASQAYMSPERLLLATNPDAQSDLWALTVSLYELLTTILPFEAPTPAGVAVAICNAQFSPPSHYRADLPPAVDGWFARSLSKSAAERFRGAAELARAFALAAGAAREASAALLAGSSLTPSTRVGDESDEDEMTVRWDVPDESPGAQRSDWAGLNPAAESHPLPSAPPPLPNRAPSSRPPPSLDHTAVRGSPAAPAATGFSLSPPTLAPPTLAPPTRSSPPSAALPRTSYLAAVASALAVPGTSVPALASSASSPAAAAQVAGMASSRALDRRLILSASAFSVLVVASAWLYSSKGSSGSASPRAETATPALASSDSSSLVAVTVRAKDLPEVGSEDDPAVASQRLPVIIHTQDLPPAPEESGEEASGDVEMVAVSPAVSPTPSPARPAAGGASRSARPGAKASCTPPYYFDANNIRRLKLECLGGSAAATAPVQKKHALTPAPPRGKSLAGNQTRAGASCSPPYYFDRNNIRRLKLECL